MNLLHPTSETPLIDEMIIAYTEPKSLYTKKQIRVVKMTEADWPLIKLAHTHWCYLNDVFRTAELLQKYVSGFNHYREEVRKIADMSQNKAVKAHCEKVVEDCAELIKG